MGYPSTGRYLPSYQLAHLFSPSAVRAPQYLAPGSYDLALDGAIIGGVVREVTASGSVQGWCAELLDDMPAATRPRPFDCIEHRFPTLEAATEWLGGAEFVD